MRGIRFIEVKNVDIFRAVWKCYEDYKPRLTLLPASLGGNYHPPDEREVGGLIKHIERMCWFILKYAEEFKISDDDFDILMASAFFHDIGSVDITKVDLQVEIVDNKVIRKHVISRDQNLALKHPLISADIAKQYLDREKVSQKIIDLICNIIKSHMAHWYPNLPLPQTELERIFAFCDYLMSREEMTCQI